MTKTGIGGLCKERFGGIVRGMGNEMERERDGVENERERERGNGE